MNEGATILSKKTAQLSTADAIVEIQDLYKSFGNNTILKGIDITLNKGENLVVLGKSGSGKSILIKCIVRLIWPDKGSIKILGEEILNQHDKALNALRLKMGFLFQSGALYDSMTVKENLEFPLRYAPERISGEKRKSIIEEALNSVGLIEAIDKMPSELSGGMRKRIGLARTLVLQPEIMLYDEPTTGLDTITSREISELIVSLQKQRKTSSIIITHDMPCAKYTADRIVIIKDGKIGAEGTYEQLEKSEDEWVRSFFT